MKPFSYPTAKQGHCSSLKPFKPLYQSKEDTLFFTISFAFPLEGIVNYY